ncbi:MAG: restriction endonuclease, partial [Christensenellaceae bacterium]|nr:restriction endonuclease [Christensenellaceae bacterium]
CGQLGEQIPTPVIGKPAIGLPGQICTETFLRIGCFVSEIDAQHCMKYMTSKFFRLLVGIKKNTQHTSASSYELIPMQDFTENSDIDWAKTVNEIDEQLSRKYDLTKEQIEYINKYIADAIT